MTDKEIQSELEALRAEVAELSKARREKRTAETAEPKGGADQPAGGGTTVEDVAAAVPDLEAATVDLEDSAAVQGQMDKLLAQLEHEIRDMPTVTTLAVFSLGVLFGRLLR